ncbi:MAG: DUF2202 domain-containing protein [Myxococcota bacterium]
MFKQVVSVAAVTFLGCGPMNAEVTDDGVASAESGLQSSEAEALRLMREEEKLARDVYLTLAAKWNLAIFSNIASSEQTHMDSVLSLLTRYRLPDPAAGNGVGVFVAPQLQALHDQLVAQGSVSMTAALTVGATIEDLDIADLQRLSGETGRADILRVYANLMKGSRNHLRSFYGQLQGAYSPQYLDQATFEAIVTSAQETGPAR